MTDFSKYGDKSPRVVGQRNPGSWQGGTRAQSQDHAPRVARKVDPDACPPGWDPDVWRFTLLFEELAERWNIRLAVGRPVIYAKLEQRIEKSGVRNAPESMRRDSKGHVRTWQDLTEAIICEYWTQEPDAKALGITHWDEYATDDFTNFEMFRFCGRKVRNRAKGRRLIAAQEEATK